MCLEIGGIPDPVMRDGPFLKSRHNIPDGTPPELRHERRNMSLLLSSRQRGFVVVFISLSSPVRRSLIFFRPCPHRSQHNLLSHTHALPTARSCAAVLRVYSKQHLEPLPPPNSALEILKLPPLPPPPVCILHSLALISMVSST